MPFPAAITPRRVAPNPGLAADDGLPHKSEVCRGALAEAGRWVTTGMFGPLLRRLLARACDLLDDIDEGLIVLDPASDHDAFARAAALHRELESVQSRIPPAFRHLIAR